MTREEAIFCEKSYIGETNCVDCKYYGTDTCQSRESHRMAIKALEQEPYKDIYDRGWKDGAEAATYHFELCIAEIKAEIVKAVCEERTKCDKDLSFLNWCAGLGCALEIMDKHISERYKE